MAALSPAWTPCSDGRLRVTRDLLILLCDRVQKSPEEFERLVGICHDVGLTDQNDMSGATFLRS